MWTAQLTLGAVFLFTGFSKIVAYEKLAQVVEARSKGRPIGVPRQRAAVLGVAEIVWALGVIIPFHFAYPYLVALVASLCLAIVMIGASFYHIRRRESAAPSIVLFLLAVFVIVGRWPWWG
jgi:uncharacterized membrane protein YphA (DoxX/SURF4 family)